MRATVELDAREGVATIRLASEIDEEELVDIRHAIEALPGYASLGVLSDWSALDPARLNPAFLRARAAIGWRPPYRLALVAPQDALYGMARLYELSTGGQGPPVAVFRDHGEALHWLQERNGNARSGAEPVAAAAPACDPVAAALGLSAAETDEPLSLGG